MATEFIKDKEIYEKVILQGMSRAKSQLWIATADLKDLYIVKETKKAKPLVELLADLLQQGVDVRLIHAKEPGKAFRDDFDHYPILWKKLKRVLCPRVHFKCVIIDGRWAYFGSANLTGAGMGAKSENRRNFENGIWTDDEFLIDAVAQQYAEVFSGKLCQNCGRKKYCHDGPIVK